MQRRKTLILLSFSIACLSILAGCSGTGSEPPATATAQMMRIQNMATQMASAVQSTSAVSMAQATQVSSDAAALLSQAQTWSVVISDTFDNNNTQWTTGVKDSDLSTENLSIDKGSYNWTATAKDGFVYWTTPITETLNDFYAAVDATIVSGPDTGETCLVFHEADTSNFYLFEMNSSKQFALSRLVNDEWQTPINWTSSDLIRIHETNRLAVLGKGSTFYLFINGSLAGSYTESDASEGSAGIAISLYNKGDTGNFTFDNFELRRP